MPEELKLLGFAGSLRAGSYNRGLLRAASELLPEGVSLEIVELGDLPLYNADVEKAGLPPTVTAFKDKIAAADGLLIATPEYNYSISGVLKNAIDWASRPAKTSPLVGKPVGIMGATSGVAGTIRAQHALRQVLVFTNSQVMAQPELRIAGAADHFDELGGLADDGLRECLRHFVERLVDWTRFMSAWGDRR